MVNTLENYREIFDTFELQNQDFSIKLINVNTALSFRKTFGVSAELSKKDLFDDDAVHIWLNYNNKQILYFRINEKNWEKLLPFDHDHNRWEAMIKNSNIPETNMGDVELNRLVIDIERVKYERIKHIDTILSEVVSEIKHHFDNDIYIAIVDFNIKKSKYLDIWFREVSLLWPDSRYQWLRWSLLVL